VVTRVEAFHSLWWWGGVHMSVHVKLIDFGENTESWAKRLYGFLEHLTIDTELDNSHGEKSTIGFCRIETLEPTTLPTHAEILKAHCHHCVAVLNPGNLSAIERIFQFGFDCYLFVGCSDRELQAVLTNGVHLEQLEARIAQAQKLESIGELASGIAHEINTPVQYVGDNTRFLQDAYEKIAAILTICQTLTDGDEPQPASLSALRSALDDADVEYLLEEVPIAIHQTLEGVDRVAHIVRAMKEFAHPGKSEMTLTDVSKAIENTVMVCRNEWKYVADLKTLFDPDLPQIPCLLGELNQVLLNMIVNAAHAIEGVLGSTPESKGRITISTHQGDECAEIRIADTGAGIAPENIERVFKPFFTTKPQGKGTGQGLAIAQNVIVEKHGGKIEVKSEVGVGTTFIIQLPLTQVPRSEDSASPLQDTALLV
jgi:signal transduction histidine kinase